MAGEDRCVVSIKDVPTGIAICADTNYSAHAASAAEGGAEVYVASVMKTEAEYRDHANSMQRYAADHGMVTLTANYAGSTGGSFSAGRSAIWDGRGSLIAQANSNQEALVVARRNNRKWHGEVVESRRGAPAVGEGSSCCRRLSPCAGASVSAIATFPLPAHRTGRAVFPHPALGRDHAFAHEKLPVRRARRASPRSFHRRSSEKRTYFPARTLCLRQSHWRSRLIACASIAS